MAEQTLDLAIPRFKGNEDRFDRFINGSNTDTFTTSTSVVNPSVAKFLKDKDTAINVAADGILAATVAAKNTAVTKAGEAAQSAADAALFNPSSYYTKTQIDNQMGVKATTEALTAGLAGKVDPTRSIGVAGIATGGGSLAADRTITVPKSTNAQALAGTDDSTAMTPVRTSEAFAAHSGVAKAWVNFDGSGSLGVRSSYGVSSVTKNSTGLYTVSFTTPFANTSYVAVPGIFNPGNGTYSWTNVNAQTAATCQIGVANGSGMQNSSAVMGLFFK